MHKRVVIVTNPSHDAITQYIHSWFEVVIDSIKKQPNAFEVYELKNSKVTRENLIKLVEEKNPNLILFHGHGSSKAIGGFESNILIACDDNEKLLENKIIHSLTCNSGEILGPKCVSCGTKAFIGYKKEFKFVHLGKTTSLSQKSDPVAELFLLPALEVDKALLEGSSLKQAHLRSKKMYADHFMIFLANKNPKLDMCKGRIYHDMINQVVLGDQDCSF